MISQETNGIIGELETSTSNWSNYFISLCTCQEIFWIILLYGLSTDKAYFDQFVPMYPTYGQVPNVYKMNVLKENFLLDFVRTLVEFFFRKPRKDRFMKILSLN